jgi:hypothetical protein
MCATEQALSGCSDPGTPRALGVFGKIHNCENAPMVTGEILQRVSTGGCPPHHWLIEDDTATSLQRWRCMRCHQLRAEALARVHVPQRKYRSMSNWSREECILAGLAEDQ